MLDPHGPNKSGDNRNMFVAVALAAIAILGYQYIMAPQVDTAVQIAEVPAGEVITTENGTSMPGTPENLHVKKATGC